MGKRNSKLGISLGKYLLSALFKKNTQDVEEI